MCCGIWWQGRVQLEPRRSENAQHGFLTRIHGLNGDKFIRASVSIHLCPAVSVVKDIDNIN